MKGFLRNVALCFAVLLAGALLSRLVLYLRVLDTSAVDIPEAILVHRLENRDSLNPSTFAHLQSVRVDSEEVIGRLFEEIRSMTLRGTKAVSWFERYPVYLMILEYGEEAQDTFPYIEVAADRRITVHKDGRTAYYGYISQDTYDMLTDAYLNADAK